jgi:hypothetical protein
MLRGLCLSLSGSVGAGAFFQKRHLSAEIEPVPAEEPPGLLGISHTQWRCTMGIEPDRWNGLVFPAGRPVGQGRAKSRGHHHDMYLCVALVILIAWAVLSVIF